MPGIASMPQLLKLTIEQLEKDGKRRGGDFAVPHLSWMYYALSANNEYSSTAARYTGLLPFKRMIQSRSSARDWSNRLQG